MDLLSKNCTERCSSQMPYCKLVTSARGLASDLNGTTSRVASGKNWVHQQHMALRNVPWQLLINQLLLNNGVTDLADASAFAWGVPIQPIGGTVLGSWVMPAVCSFTIAKQKDAYV